MMMMMMMMMIRERTSVGHCGDCVLHKAQNLEWLDGMWTTPARGAIR